MEYFNENSIVDRKDVLDLMTMDEFIGIHQEAVDASCMDVTEKAVLRVTDEQAKILIQKISKCENISDFQHLDPDQRNKYLKKLREKGLSIRQLSRLTGISFSVVRNI
jgi:hypothetical protein